MNRQDLKELDLGFRQGYCHNRFGISQSEQSEEVYVQRESCSTRHCFCQPKQNKESLKRHIQRFSHKNFLVSILTISTWMTCSAGSARETKLEKRQHREQFWRLLSNTGMLKSVCSFENEKNHCEDRAEVYRNQLVRAYEELKPKFQIDAETEKPFVPLLNTSIKKLDRSSIVKLTQHLENAILDQIERIPRPVLPLNLELARQAYLKSCASCHGSTGSNEGTLNNKLTQKPKAFSQAWRDGVILPLNYYAYLVAGIADSEMPSFLHSLDQDEMWNIAFYVAALRYAGAICDMPHRQIDLNQLVRLTDDELRKSASASPACPDVAVYFRTIAAWQQEIPRGEDDLSKVGGIRHKAVLIAVALFSLVGAFFMWVLLRARR